MRALLATSGGFLLAVLWFDLMFDVQVLGAPVGPLPEPVLASIAGYYARVTIEAAPMGRLVAVAMAIAVLGSARDLRRRTLPLPLAATALLASAAPVTLAVVRVLPNAVQLGRRLDPPAVQSDLARAICYDHLACFAGILLFCAIQIAAGRRPPSTG